MKKDDLQSVLVGRNVDIYNDLAKLVRKLDANSRFRQVDLTEESIVATLKKISGPSLIFISDEVAFSLELLSDLTWQYNPDAIVVIVTEKSKTVSIKELFNNTQFSRVNLSKNNPESDSILQFLIQSVKEKAAFRRCKKLLGVSEKRCQWLVDSSREAIAFISRDIHWYANSAYLKMFEVSSIQKLRSIVLKDIILSDEHLLFEGFQKNQGKSSNNRKSILLSMKRLNGSTFRASVYLIPSVFKGHKCYQLWVRKVGALPKAKSNQADLLKESISSLESPINVGSKGDNPFSSILNKDSVVFESSKENTFVEHVAKKKLRRTFDQNSLLKGVIKRKEANIFGSPLKYLKHIEQKNIEFKQYQLVSLRVAIAQKKGVDELLKKLSDNPNLQESIVFWDKVKLSRVIRALLQKDKVTTNLLLQLNELSVMDEDFINWLIPGLERLGTKAKNITFLIPSNINVDQYKEVIKVIKQLRKFKCQIALDSFSVNKNSKHLLKYTKPDFVRLSLPWVRRLEGSEQKEIKLSSVIRLLESKNIKVIAPCNFSKDMRRLFILSGASFCQETIIKNV